jgi:hypothetical protein
VEKVRKEPIDRPAIIRPGGQEIIYGNRAAERAGKTGAST